MTKYDLIHKRLQSKVNKGELTLEYAQRVNDIAYKKYRHTLMTESKDDIVEILDKIKSGIEDGSIELSRYQKACIREICDSCCDGDCYDDSLSEELDYD